MDFSKCSIDGLKFAAIVARKTKSEICILHIIHRQILFIPGLDSVVMSPVTEQEFEKKFYGTLIGLAEKKLQHLFKASYLKGLKITSKIDIGINIYQKIVEHSKQIKADMIIMGSKGLNGTKQILIGSNAQRVVRFSEIPVIVTPHEIKRIKKIVFASDFEKESYKIFPSVKAFAEIFGAQICLLKINTFQNFESSNENIKLLSAFNQKFKADYKVFIQNDYVKESGIIEYANRVNADMIAIGTHARKGLARFFRGDVTGNVIRMTFKPVFVSKLKQVKSK